MWLKKTRNVVRKDAKCGRKRHEMWLKKTSKSRLCKIILRVIHKLSIGIQDELRPLASVSVIDCLIRSFKLTGGVPKEILFDNTSSVVTFSGGHATVSNAMKEFAKDFGFQIKRCKARHAYTSRKEPEADG